MNWIEDLKHDIGSIKSTENELKKFGILIGSIFLLVALFSFWNNWFEENIVVGFSIIGTIFIISGYFIPKRLKKIYLVWMSIAILIGSIISRLILFILFFIVLTPISLIARIFGKTFFVKHKDQELKSYWLQRDGNKKINYERMY